MTFLEWKQIVKELVQYDNDVPFDLNNIALSTSISNRLFQYLNLFCEQSYCIHVSRQALTLTGKDTNTEIDLSDTGIIGSSGNPIFSVEDIWLDTKTLRKMSGEDMHEQRERSITGSSPAYWAQGNLHTVLLDKQIGSDYATAGGTVSGWGLHPALTADSDVLSISENRLDPAAYFAAYHLMRGVVTGESALRRRSEYRKIGTTGALVIKSEQLRDYHE